MFKFSLDLSYCEVPLSCKGTPRLVNIQRHSYWTDSRPKIFTRSLSPTNHIHEHMNFCYVRQKEFHDFLCWKGGNIYHSQLTLLIHAFSLVQLQFRSFFMTIVSRKLHCQKKNYLYHWKYWLSGWMQEERNAFLEVTWPSFISQKFV